MELAFAGFHVRISIATTEVKYDKMKYRLGRKK
jgi:hypothetical protein